MTPKEQYNALTQIFDTIVEAVAAAGELGAPGGTIYAALMSMGCSLQQYQQLMAMLVKAGRLRMSGQLYFVATPVPQPATV